MLKRDSSCQHCQLSYAVAGAHGGTSRVLCRIPRHRALPYPHVALPGVSPTAVLGQAPRDSTATSMRSNQPRGESPAPRHCVLPVLPKLSPALAGARNPCHVVGGMVRGRSFSFSSPPRGSSRAVVFPLISAALLRVEKGASSFLSLSLVEAPRLSRSR